MYRFCLLKVLTEISDWNSLATMCPINNYFFYLPTNISKVRMVLNKFRGNYLFSEMETRKAHVQCPLFYII